MTCPRCPRCRRPTDRHTQVQLGIWLVRKYPLLCKACLCDMEARRKDGRLHVMLMDVKN